MSVSPPRVRRLVPSSWNVSVGECRLRTRGDTFKSAPQNRQLAPRHAHVVATTANLGPIDCSGTHAMTVRPREGPTQVPKDARLAVVRTGGPPVRHSRGRG